MLENVQMFLLLDNNDFLYLTYDFSGDAYVRFQIIAHRLYQNNASSNPIYPKFCCRGNEGRPGKNSVRSIRWPIPELPPHGRKNLADISYTDRVIENVVPKFVAMATAVARKEI